ncbi:hypothetical protein [Chitinophaga filiformis]|uniref:Uncharacterized protein n=1 Tax=Chitinophaga filiformis TaxID=104663 RepID=A0A1G8B144_CHIFI|nr:hypothetical protein [Chitinophaga filiformis]SDH26753.1 hypothetical protein SAMN04488121_11065 [Chitinophaga filiformis]
MKIYFHSSLFIFLAFFSIIDCFGQKGNSLSLAAISFLNPSGVGGHLGTAGIGLAGQNRVRGGRIAKPDGNVGVYLGLGDPYKYIGVGATVNIFGLSNTYGSIGNLGEGGLDISINRLFLKVLFLKLGVCNITNWRVEKHAIPVQKSYFGTGTVFFRSEKKAFGEPFSYIAFTAGAGNGLFRKDNDLDLNNSGHFNPFVSVAFPIFRKNNVIVEWTGYDISTCISSSILFFKKVPILINLQATDYVLQPMRFGVSIGYYFNYLKTHQHDKKKNYEK